MCSTRLCVFYLLALISLGAAKNVSSECPHFNAKGQENEFSCVKNDTSKKISCSLSPSDGRKTESIVFLCDGSDQWNKNVTHKKISVIEAKKMSSKPCEIEITHSGILRVSVIAYMKHKSSLEVSLKSNGKNNVSVGNKTCLNKWQEIEVEINSAKKSYFSISRKLQNHKNGYWAISDIRFYSKKQQTTTVATRTTKSLTPTAGSKNSTNKDTVSTTPRNEDQTISVVAPKNSCPQYLPSKPKGNGTEFSCVKNDTSKKISCSLSSSDGGHRESILLLCDGSDNWSNNVIREKNLHQQLIKDLVIKRNALEISNLENRSYKFSVCSMENFTINQIQVINTTEKNDGFQTEYACTNWTKCILTKNKTSNGSWINITHEKGTNKNKILSIGEFVNTHAYLHILGNKASFWKLHEMEVIEANTTSGKPCEMEITHSGIFTVSVIAYMKHKSSLEVSLKSNGYNNVSVENKTCSHKWQEIEVEINSTNKSYFSIIRRLQNHKNGYWAISDIRFYSKKQPADKNKNKNESITTSKSTVSSKKTTNGNTEQNTDTKKVQLTIESFTPTAHPKKSTYKNTVSTNNTPKNKDQPASVVAPKNSCPQYLPCNPKGNDTEFFCVKNNTSKKISCSLSSSNGSHTESILLLCDGSDSWNKNVIFERDLNKTQINNLVIKRNALDISNLENRSYNFSVCSMKTFPINQIQVINKTEKNDGFETEYSCTNWTEFTLTKHKTSNGSWINITNKKGTNENKSLSIGEFANTHAYLHMPGNKASFWKFHEMEVIEANTTSNKSCEMEITYSGILKVSVIAYMKHNSGLVVSLTSNGTNSNSVESKTCRDKWQKIEVEINSTNKSVFSINRKLQKGKGYWAISDIRFYTTNQNTSRNKDKNKSTIKQSSTTSTQKTTTMTSNLKTDPTTVQSTAASFTTTIVPIHPSKKNIISTNNVNKNQPTSLGAPKDGSSECTHFSVKHAENENEFSCVKDGISKKISCSLSSSDGGKTKSIVLLCAGSHNWNKSVTHEKNLKNTQKEVKVIEANTTSNKSCEMEITHSGILKVSVIAKMKDNSSLVVLLKSNGKNNTTNESKSCSGEWQKIDLEIDSTNTSYFSISRKLYDGRNGYWAIRDIRFYTIKPKSCTTESCGSARKTTEKTTTKSSLPSNTAPASSTTKNISNNSTSQAAALICLIVLLILTLILLGYLYYAYRKSKYPFDVRRPESIDPDDFFEEERKEFSDFHKRHMVKTVRTKAHPPIKESELEVFIEPTNKFESNISSLPIKIKDFEDYLMTSLGDDPYSNDLTRQYRTMQGKIQKSATAGSQTKYIGKNRYRNLIAFDNTRVILRDNDCDYINANYIDGFENKKAFIATQAPLKSTLGDFWCMIWQEKVTTIVMLTELIENGVTKCEQYWPDVEQKARYGKILIENISVNLHSDYIERTLSVKCEEEVRMIRHLQYVTWPDHGVPVYPQNFTPFIKKILLISQKESPIVVHCNAGCGRTGTLILCDIVLRMAAKEKTLDFVKVLKKMREQRANLVNNVNQYVFAHFVVLECLFGIDFSIAVNDSFQDEVDKVLRKITIKPMMEHLDKVMEQFKKRQACFFPNMSDDDKKKNRFSKILPSHTQLFLPMSSENPSSYINAVVVDCYRCPKKFIVTQQPLPNTINDFWTVIKEFEVNTVVSLNEIGENDPDCPQFWHWSNESTTLKIINEEENRTFSTLKVKVTDESNQNEKTVNVLNMKGWKRNMRYPTKSNDLILVWKEMFSSSWKGDSQIVVTCYDGATASGLFVALAYLLEKINYEQTCDVFSAIRTVRQCREEFVQEWGQMEFLYKAAKVYIEEFDNYDNFSV